MIRSGSAEPWLTWIGHASFLGSLAGARFLIDPVFSNHAGWLYRRHLPPAMKSSDLPDLAAVMVTHNHYDHLDSPFIRSLPPEVPIVVPSGLGRWMRRCRRERVLELEWWKSTVVNDLKMTLVPACHWSRRGVFDTNRTLWGGFVIRGGDHSVYHAGDSAFSTHFAEIGRSFPDLDAAILPIGGYHPAWFMEHYHLNPEQAGQAFEDLGARRLLPMHWGTFQLTDESLCEPAERMLAWWKANRPGHRARLELLSVGETLALDGPDV